MPRKRHAEGITKDRLIGLLLDIIAVNGTDMLPAAVERAHARLARSGLWKDEPLPVVNSNENAEVYGWATSPHYAKVMASECMLDVTSVEQYGPVRLQDGTEYPEAYVVITKPLLEERAA